MRVICPLVACASIEKRDQFMNLLRDIADVTLATEPKTIAYGWFASGGSNDQIPGYWVRGFEVYQDEEAHLQVHRASGPYKKMRETIGPESMLTQPIELCILQPCGVGFLSQEKKKKACCIFQDRTDSHQIVIIVEYSLQPDQKPALLQALQRVADYAASHEQSTTLSFWGLEYIPDQNNHNHGIVLFTRFADSAAYDAHQASVAVADLKSMEQALSLNSRVTRWVESGIGFINRENR